MHNASLVSGWVIRTDHAAASRNRGAKREDRRVVCPARGDRLANKSCAFYKRQLLRIRNMHRDDYTMLAECVDDWVAAFCSCTAQCYTYHSHCTKNSTMSEYLETHVVEATINEQRTLAVQLTFLL